MTYYEMIVFLEEIINKPRSEEFVKKLDTANIYLEGDRYHRFIDELSRTINYRLNNSLGSMKEKISLGSIDENRFVVEFNDIKDEINYAFKLTSTSLVDDKNRRAFDKSIKESARKIIEEIKSYFSTNTLIQNELDKFVKKEGL